MPRNKLSLTILVLFLIFITWLGARGIAGKSLWYDEIWSIRYAGGNQFGPIPLNETVSRVIEQSNIERNPPGYYVLLNTWGHAVGWTEFSTRVFSLLAGLLAIAWTYRIGYDLARNESASHRLIIGISAAVTLGAEAFFIEYAQEVRAYIFIVLLTAMSLALYWRMLNTPRRLSALLQFGFVLTCVALLYLHYSTILYLGVLGLYHVLIAKKNARWWRIFILFAVSALLFLPWLSVFLKAGQTAVDIFKGLAWTPPEIVQAVGVSFSNDSIAFLAVLLLLALLVRGRHAGFVWFLAAVGLTLALIGNNFIQIIINPRYLIFLWPLLALLMGLSIAYLARHKITPLPFLSVWIVVGGLTSINLATSRIPHDTHFPWKTMVSVLRQNIQQQDVVIFHEPLAVWSQGPEFEYYMNGFANRSSLTEAIGGVAEHDEYVMNARKFVGDAPHIWLGVDQTLAPNFRLAEFKRAIADNYVHCYTAFKLPEMSFDMYSRIVTTPDLRFGDGIGLKLDEPPQVQLHQSLSVLLGIQEADTVPHGTYSVGLHIDDSAGKLLAQSDFGLPGEGQSCNQATINIATLAPGTYHLMAVVYDWRTGQRLSGKQSDGTTGDRLQLATFTVGR